MSVDPDAGTIEVAFDAGETFLNRAGQVQGGFLAPATPGELRGRGRVVRRGRALFAFGLAAPP